MTKGWIGGLLIAATALTPVAASAQDGGFGSRIVREARGGIEGNGRRDVDRAPNPERQQRQEQRQQQRNDRPRVRQQAPQQDQQADPAPQQYRPRNDAQRGNNRAADARRQDRQDGSRWQDRRADGNRDGNRGFGTGVIRDAQRAADRANNGAQGRYDGREWDRNRDGVVDNRWDRNDNGRVDRRWDRDRDGNLDRRYDRDRDGRYDGRDRYDNRTGQRWNHSWRNDRRYDWRGHRSRYSDHYRLGRYYAPYRNYSYRRLSIGFALSSLFYSDNYWINDPWSYRLPDVYGPYRWVRYYDDALLVDLRTGEVVDTIYSFFW